LYTGSRDDGNIDLINGNNKKNKISKSRIKFKNKNSLPYTVYYTITAQQCNGANTIELDPKIQNLGK
jgi:hypothetical protein